MDSTKQASLESKLAFFHALVDHKWPDMHYLSRMMNRPPGPLGIGQIYKELVPYDRSTLCPAKVAQSSTILVEGV